MWTSANSKLITCFRSLLDHPILLITILIILIIYRFIPVLFFFLVRASPVFACTGVLLGVILAHGGPHEAAEDDSERLRRTRRGIANLRSGVAGNEVRREKDLMFWGRDGGYEGCVSSSSSSSGSEESGKRKAVEGGRREGEDEGDSVENEVGEKEEFGFVRYSSITEDAAVEEESKSESDSDSDLTEESTSPEPSMVDIMPMLDELHPLLDSEPSRVAAAAAPGEAEESEDEKVENTEIDEDDNDDDNDDEDEDEEEDKQGGEEDGTKAVVTWTKEDEKNLMLLGNSELERNRRLETMIARRRMRNSFKMLSEKNLIDFDAQPQMAQISTTRSNPFDLHYNSNDSSDLPPVPGSAPSVLRRNPFDIPYDPLEEKPDLAGGSFAEEFSPRLERDAHIRRYESFSTGSYLEKTVSKFRPYFVPTPAEGAAYSALQREMSPLSDSKMSSVAETESVASTEQESSQLNHDNVQEPDHVKPEHSSSGEVDVGDSVEETTSIASASDRGDQPIDLVERVRDDVNLESSSSDDGNLQEILSTSVEMESTASPMASDATDVNINPEAAEENTNADPKSDSTHKDSNAQPLVDDSNAVEEANDTHKEPVYDSHWSPSEAEKTLSGITIIQEALSYMSKKVFTSTSDTNADTRSSSGDDHSVHQQETTSPMVVSVEKSDLADESSDVANMHNRPTGQQGVEIDISRDTDDDSHEISTSENVSTNSVSRRLMPPRLKSESSWADIIAKVIEFEVKPNFKSDPANDSETDFSQDESGAPENVPTDSAPKVLMQPQLKSESGWAEIIAKVIEFEVKPNFRNALGGRKKSFKKSKSGVRETPRASTPTASTSTSATVINDVGATVVDDSSTTVVDDSSTTVFHDSSTTVFDDPCATILTETAESGKSSSSSGMVSCSGSGSGSGSDSDSISSINDSD